jgi:type I restriction enzyme S subunit
VAGTGEPNPNGWTTVTVSQVGAVRVGRQRSPDRQTGQFPTKYIRAANIVPEGLDLSEVLEMDFSPAERETYRLEPSDILLAEASGTPAQVGRAVIWKGEIPDCCFQNTVIRFRPHAVIADYALIVFRHLAETGVFAAAARGVGIQHLGVTRFAEIPFQLPPLAEQRRIADEVQRRLSDLASAEAALNSALAHTFEQDRLILEAAVTGMLVEPEAELAARENRPFETAIALLARLRPGVDAELPLFADGDEDKPTVLRGGPPSGWAIPAVGEVGEVRLGRQRAPQYERGEYPTPYLRAANITADGLDLSDILHMDFTSQERRVYELHPGDILLAEASGSPAQVGRSAIWQGDIPGCCYQNTVIRFRSVAASPNYALLVFGYMAESGAFGREARGLGIQHLGAARFAAMPFPLPPAVEQDRIVAEAEARLAASRAQRGAVLASLGRFGAMRREIRIAAVSGRLAVQDPEDEPAEVLLARLGPPVEAARSRQEAIEKEQIVIKPPRRRLRKTTIIKSLPAVLAEAGRAVALPDLFAMAGYDRDSAGDIERFYLALRDQVGRRIEPVGDAPENAIVELRNAP